MKNCFGITPASIYGETQGWMNQTRSRSGARKCLPCGPASTVEEFAAGNRPGFQSRPGYRMPRIVADLAVARPIDLALIDGIETVAGGEGPWIRGLRAVRPSVIMAVPTLLLPTRSTAVMGYDPRARKEPLLSWIATTRCCWRSTRRGHYRSEEY